MGSTALDGHPSGVLPPVPSEGSTDWSPDNSGTPTGPSLAGTSAAKGEQCSHTDAADGDLSAARVSFRAEARRALKPWTGRLGLIGAMLLAGGAALLLSWGIGAVMAAVHMNEGEGGHLTACALESAGARPGLSDKPWELEHPQWLLGVIVTGTFVVRKHVFPAVAGYAYAHLPPEKRQKAANYMLEVFATTAVLVIQGLTGYWGLLFSPADYEHAQKVSPDQLYSFSWGMNLSFCCFLSAYIMEMAFDEHMRSPLVIHHGLTLLLSFWAWWCLGILGGDLMVLRIVFAFQLHMSTEGAVFVVMLLYHAKTTKAFVFTLVAWYYTLSRILITVASLWVWWDGRDSIFQKHEHNSVVVYSIFVFVPAANLILNATQTSTVLNLFGIAKKVRVNAKQHNTQRRLGRIFDVIDFDQGGTVSREEWMLYVQATLEDMGLPRWGAAATFDAMDAEAADEVSFDQFARFFEPLMLRYASDQTMLKVVILLCMLEKECLSVLERELYLSYIDAALGEDRRKTRSMSVDSPGSARSAHGEGSALEAWIESVRSREIRQKPDPPANGAAA